MIEGIIALYVFSWFVCVVMIGSMIENDPVEHWLDSLTRRGNMLGITYVIKMIVVGLFFPLICVLKFGELLLLDAFPIVVKWLFSRPDGDTDD